MDETQALGGRSHVGLGSSIERALRDVARVFDAGPSGMVIGGIAVVARGAPRTTRDVDLTFVGADLGIAELVAVLGGAGIVPRIADAAEFAAINQVLLLRHTETGVDIDVARAWLPFELEAIAAATEEQLGGVRLPIARPEDLVIYKAIAWRPQDQQDVERLIVLHLAAIDLERVRRHVRELGDALEVDRLGELDALIDRVRAR